MRLKPHLSPMRSPLFSVLMLGLLLQATAGAMGFLHDEGMVEAMRYGARYSGRISFLAYLVSMLVFTRWLSGGVDRTMAVHTAVLFAWMHLLHFGYLAANISMSAITPEPMKVAGGALAYGMILTHPLWVRRLRPRHGWHVVHFLYVGLVMILTFVARLKGEFPGADPSPVHGVGIAVCLLAIGAFLWQRRALR